MRLFKPKRVPLAQTQPEFDQMAVDFLTANGFDPSPEYLATFGQVIRMLKQDQDTFDPDEVARKIRKAKADALCFYLIRPQDRPKEEKTADEASTKTDS